MRVRKKKNGAARLAACAELFCEKTETPRADSAADFGRQAETRLEIGCGKGGFICAMAAREPEVNFYALERVNDVIKLAAERAMAEKEHRPTDNLRFFLAGADDLPALFAEGTLDVIYLNFSDPWPKKGHAKRRLTYRRYLEIYFSLLKSGGMLRLKTDNVGLFDFTLEELEALGITPEFVTRDLHAAPESADNIMTEYERHFSELGTPICSLWVTKK